MRSLWQNILNVALVLTIFMLDLLSIVICEFKKWRRKWSYLFQNGDNVPGTQ